MTRLLLSVTLLSLLFAGVAAADPAPFGLELNKATEKEVLAKYSGSHAGINRYSGGAMYQLEPGQFGFDGLRKLTVIFDRDGRLVAVLTGFHKRAFERLNGLLKPKYTLVSETIPFVGNKSVRYRDGGSEIHLDAPHMSFEMSMNYLTSELLEKFRADAQAEAEQQRAKQSSSL